MDDTQRDRIAAAVNMLRPDWPVASLRTLMGRPVLRDRPARDVAVALTWVACDPRSETPARVLLAGAWWRAAAAEAERPPAGLTMAEGCHCGRRLHAPDEDCPDPGRRRPVKYPGPGVAEARAAYLAATGRAKGAGEESRMAGP